MKKIITKRDIKAMNLTEDELFFIEPEFDELNKLRENNQSARIYFADEYRRFMRDKRVVSAYDKAVKYFAKKYMKEHGYSYQCSLRAVARYIANIFYTSTEIIICTLKGLAHLDKAIYVSDTYGLDLFQYDYKGQK